MMVEGTCVDAQKVAIGVSFCANMTETPDHRNITVEGGEEKGE
jgi:hypothetical protein